MLDDPESRFSLIRTVPSTHAAQEGGFLSVQSLGVTWKLSVVIGLLALSSTALGQIIFPVEPALPGSVEYWLTTNNYTWVRTSDPITVGSYVEDLIYDSRWNQPEGRGRIGIVTEIGWDPSPYDEWAATVDFGRNYSVGLVFSELSAVQLVPIPEPSSLLLLLSGVLLTRAVPGARGRARATS